MIVLVITTINVVKKHVHVVKKTCRLKAEKLIKVQKTCVFEL